MEPTPLELAAINAYNRVVGLSSLCGFALYMDNVRTQERLIEERMSKDEITASVGTALLTGLDATVDNTIADFVTACGLQEN